MSDEKRPPEFFLGANTPDGFISLFDQFTSQAGWRCFIIKGGPGCGKSTLIRKVAQAFEGRYSQMEYILCSSDTSSLDALVIPELRAAVVDGTPPHSLEARYPGAVETIVDMGRCWDSELLYRLREPIVEQFAVNEDMSRQAAVFMTIARTLTDINSRLVSRYTDLDKVKRLSAKICKQELGRTGRKAGEQRRFISALTADGQVFLRDTIPLLAERVYLLEDSYSVYAPTMLGHLRNCALERSYGVISCYCPLEPQDKLEHLFIPELSLAFVTANSFHSPEINPCKVINARRFTDASALKLHKKTLAHNKRTARYMLETAYEFLDLARAAHNRLEGYYNSAMNYEETSLMVAKITDTLEGIALSKSDTLR